jgi:exopolyphosphatase/pppGpp-phosphohydrolase
MQALFDFVKYNCDTYGIDESHGLKHAMGTVTWAERLMAGQSDISDDERLVIIYAAALHDMCDSKYRDSYDVACAEIRAWLLTQGFAEDLVSALIAIITTMSYSKLKRLATGYPDHGFWTRAYHIVRHADLLEGYKVVRCYLYSLRRLPGASEDELWLETEKLFNERVFKYVSDGWLFLPAALAYIPELEREARRCLRERDATYVV